MQREWDFVSWFDKLVELMEAGQIVIDVRGWNPGDSSNFQLRATDVDASGGPVKIIYDQAAVNEEWRKSREEAAREEAGGDG